MREWTLNNAFSVSIGSRRRFFQTFCWCWAFTSPSQSTYEVSTSNKYLIVLVRSSSFVILMSCDLLCVVNISARFDRNKPWNKKNNSTSIHSRGKQRTFMMMNRPASNLLLLRIIPQFQRCSEWNCPQWKKINAIILLSCSTQRD